MTLFRQINEVPLEEIAANLELLVAEGYEDWQIIELIRQEVENTAGGTTIRTFDTIFTIVAWKDDDDD